MIDRLLKRLVSQGMPRLLAGDSLVWVVLAVVAYFLRRARNRPDKPVLTFPLDPGQRYLVTLNEPQS